MKTASELADSLFRSADEHKRRATQLKRVAGGIRSEIAAAGTTGLSQAETLELSKAATLLDTLSARYTSAQKLAQQKQLDKQLREKQITAAMAGNFTALSTIPDKVALIGAVQSYTLKPEIIGNQRDLDFQFREALGSLAYTLAGQMNGQHPTIPVADAWTKFETERPRLIDRYKSMILTMEAKAASTAK